MNRFPPHRPNLAWLRVAALAGLALQAGGALAQYKVVGPDGRITYTDRPTPGATALGGASRAANAASSAASGASIDAAVPYAVRQLATRSPVTLLTGPNCVPCDDARALLRQRGVPHTERIAATAADVNELQRVEQTNEVPILRVGTQRLVGYQSDSWAALLDGAGYPRQSQLPPSYRPAPAQPLVSPQISPQMSPPARAANPTNGLSPADPRSTAPQVTPPPSTAPGEGGVRF